MARRPWSRRVRIARFCRRQLAPLRALARAHGYALTVHGSRARDLDLVACPWTDTAAPPPELAEALRVALGAFYGWKLGERTVTLRGCPGDKPHGRLTWILFVGHGLYIDLSVYPRRFV